MKTDQLTRPNSGSWCTTLSTFPQYAIVELMHLFCPMTTLGRCLKRFVWEYAVYACRNIFGGGWFVLSEASFHSQILHFSQRRTWLNITSPAPVFDMSKKRSGHFSNHSRPPSPLYVSGVETGFFFRFRTKKDSYYIHLLGSGASLQAAKHSKTSIISFVIDRAHSYQMGHCQISDAKFK